MPKAVLSSKEILGRLIGFDTTSYKSNLELIHWVQNYLEGYGVTSQLLYDPTKNKANLYAVIGPEDKAGIVLSGHTDVVPVEGQAWDRDPFQLFESNGLLYGRGTCDMKGFIAVALSRVPEMVAKAGITPIHFALSYDEEVTCLGAYDIAKHLDQMTVKPKLCIVGEPTSMKSITGHKGICAYDCAVHGKEAHSSLAPYAVNAVEYAAELVTFIKSLARRMASEGPFNTEFDPPFTTVHTGVLKGGTALNIVPQRCDFSFEIRNVPEVNTELLVKEIQDYARQVLEPQMKRVDAKSGFDFTDIGGAPAFNISNDDPAVAYVLSLSGANETEKASFATEAGIYQTHGVPTVICGPGNIAQAHKPNEFISLEQLGKCEMFMDRLLGRG